MFYQIFSKNNKKFDQEDLTQRPNFRLKWCYNSFIKCRNDDDKG